MVLLDKSWGEIYLWYIRYKEFFWFFSSWVNDLKFISKVTKGVRKQTKDITCYKLKKTMWEQRAFYGQVIQLVSPTDG